MTDSADTQIRDGLESVLQAARQRLHEAEGVAAIIPQLRSQIREIERSLKRLDNVPNPQRATGPTISESILTYLHGEGGAITFAPGGMLPMVHNAIGRHKSSVQVEIHRLERTGQILINRNEAGKPIGMRVAARPTLAAVQAETLREG